MARLLILLLIIALYGCVSEPVSSTVSTGIIANQLDKSTDKITASIDRAIIDSDYLLEKNLRSLDVIAQNLSNRLEDEMGVNREFASRELTRLTDSFSKLVDQAEGGLLNLEDFIVLDIQNFINQMPFKDDEYIIRKFKGYSQKYQSSGHYEFIVIGNAFRPGRSYEIKINNTKIDDEMIFGGAAANTLRFSVPVGLLNPKFEERMVARVPVHIRVNTKSKAVNVYQNDILLLPKYPIKYRLTETVKSISWSEQISTQSCERSVGPTGQNGKWDNRPMRCVVDDPKETRFSKQLSANPGGSHSRAENASFSANNTVATSTCHNQCHDCSRTCKWVFGVQEKVYGYGDNSLVLVPLSLDAPESIVIDDEQLISFGTFAVNLSEEYSTFTLAAEYFNGVNHVLHPVNLNEGSLSAIIDSDDANNSNFKRLIVEIDNPFN